MGKTKRENVIQGLKCCNPNEYCCGVCPYDDGYESCARCKPALHSDAITLLKKQEPVLIKSYTEVEYGFKPKIKVGKCPNCDRILNELCNYCSKCGQAVKWDE